MALLTAHLYPAIPIRTAAMSEVPYSPGVEARFHFITKFKDEVNMSIRSGNTLWIPREFAPVGAEDHRVRKTTIAINCNFVPRDKEQETLIPKSVALLLEDRNHIFEAPTGWGKTIAGLAIACAMGQPTLIVVTKEDLLNQWKSASLLLGIDQKLIGHIQQDVCDYKGKMIVFAMVHSLVIPGKYDPEMYKYFGLMILDEVHLMAAETFQRACQIIPAYYRLGLSATPDRPDGKTKLLFGHVGPVLVRGTIVPMVPKILLRKTGWRIPMVKKYKNGGIEYEKIYHKPGRMMLVLKAMAQDQSRNLEITQFVKAAYNADRTTLLLSDLIEGHLHLLAKLLAADGIPGEQIGYYIGGMSEQALGVTKKCKIVLGTYQMCSTGTNVPHWDTLVMCTPRSNVKQTLGRVLRTMIGKKEPVILDLIDYDKIFNSFYLNRLGQYYELDAKIVRM